MIWSDVCFVTIFNFTLPIYIPETMIVDKLLATLLARILATDASSWFWLCSLGVALYCMYRYHVSSGWTGMPPGPFFFPIVGAMPWWRSRDYRKEFARFRRKYGDVFSMRIGMSPTYVVVNGYEAYKEAMVLKGNSFLGRGEIFLLSDIQENKGIVCSEGDTWREHRRFVMHTLRDFGFGKSSLETMIRVETEQLIKALSATGGAPLNPKTLLLKAGTNAISMLAFDTRLEYDDPEMDQHLADMSWVTEKIGADSVSDAFPFLKYLPWSLGTMSGTVRHRDAMFDRFRGRIRACAERLRRGEEARDLISRYLKQMAAAPESGIYSEDQLVHVMLDLYVASSDTTVCTLCWAILYLTRNQHVQKQFQAEIDNIVGEGHPSLSSYPSMPYVEACISEVQRLADIIPAGVPRATLGDVIFRGYFLPRGTKVLFIMSSMFHSPEVWGNDAMSFRPERFLDDRGRYVRKPEHLPFSLGKRDCLGKSMARMELFLFLVSILQNYDVLPVDDLDTAGVLGLTYHPRDYRVRFVPRERHAISKRCNNREGN